MQIITYSSIHGKPLKSLSLYTGSRTSAITANDHFSAREATVGKRNRPKGRNESRPGNAESAPTEASASPDAGRAAPNRRRLWILVAVLVVGLLAIGWWRGQRYGLDQAHAALRRGEPSVAMDWIRWSDRYVGTTADSRLLLAKVERRLGHLEASEMSIQAAAALGADMPNLLREQILLRAQLGQLDNPSQYLEQLLPSDVDDQSEVYESFARGYLLTGKLDDAHRLVTSWSERLPQDPLPHYFLGVMQRDLGWSSEAVGEFREALRRDPRHAQSALELAILTMRNHRYVEAIPLYETALAKDPNDVRARVGLAHSLRMLGETRAAREALTPVVNITRPDIGVIAELGRIDLMEGNYEKALQHFESARRLMPRNSEVSYAYASTLAALARHNEAKSPFEFAIEGRRANRKIAELGELVKARPDDLALRCDIAALSLRYGDPRAAMGWAQSALQKNPDYEPAKQIVEQIQSASQK